MFTVANLKNKESIHKKTIATFNVVETSNATFVIWSFGFIFFSSVWKPAELFHSHLKLNCI